MNKNKIYESLFIQKIQMENNEECIKDLFNYFDKKTQILIAEIIPKNSFNFIKPITNENKNKNIYNCSLCGEQFNIREKYICQLCNLSLFCSYNCAKISGEHINLHQALNKFYIRNFEVEKLLSEKMSLFKDDITMVMSDLPNGKALAKCYYIDEDNKYSLNQRICKIHIKDNKIINSKYLFYLLNRNPYYLKFDDGVNQTNLKKDDILNIDLNIPSLDIQNKNSKVLTTIDYLINKESVKLTKLETLKKGLMQNMFV